MSDITMRLRAALQACGTVADPVVEVHATDSVWADLRAEVEPQAAAAGIAWRSWPRAMGLVVFAVRRGSCLVTRSGARHPLPAGKPRPL